MVHTLSLEGELLPPRHGGRQDDEDGHRRGIPPLRQGAEMGLDWFSMATEASGGGTPDLISVLEVWVYIRGVGVGNKSGGPRGGHEVGGAPRG